MNEQPPVSDGEVVRRVRGGEVELFRVLMERYRAEFGRYAAAMLGDGDAAADVVQESFIAAWRSLGECREPERFKAWCFRIVANRCRDVQRRRPSAPLEDELVVAKETADGPLRDQELAEALHRALATLTDEQREAFVLKHVEGRSYQEMAELLQTGVDALKMRVHRARDALRQALGDMT